MRPLPDGHHSASLKILQRQHPQFKELRDLRDHPTPDLLFLEGPRLIEEAQQAKLPLRTVIVCRSLLSTEPPNLPNIIETTESIFRSISDVEEPQGILAVCERPRWTWEELLAKSPSPIVILDGLQDPGNAATIIRTAEAAGAAGLVTTPGTVHLYSPKALRGAMGSSMRVPILEHVPIATIAAKLEEAGYRLVTTTSLDLDSKATSYDQFDWKKPCGILLGQEAQGASKAWASHTATQVFIPMQAPVQSLNVAQAAAVLLYEAYRVRTLIG